MELIVKDPIFSDLLSLDEAYFRFMHGVREEIAEACMASSSAYCFHFIKDGAFDVEEQTKYVWESVKEERDPSSEGGFAYPGRVSVASMDTLATFNTADMDAETEIPEIPFSKLGRTSLTGEEFANALLAARVEECDEEDEGSAHPVPYQGSAHTPGGLPFGRRG